MMQSHDFMIINKLLIWRHVSLNTVFVKAGKHNAERFSLTFNQTLYYFHVNIWCMPILDKAEVQ